MIPRILLADAYTIGSGTHVSKDAKAYSAYQAIFRKRPEWMDDVECESRFIVHGLQRIMRDILGTPVTAEEVDEADRFLKTFHAGGLPFTWDRAIWDRVVTERSGLIPIRMWALRDGFTCFPGEPILQIEAMDGFGEFAGYFESKILQVWAPSERATLMRALLDYNKDLVKRCSSGYLTDEQLEFQAALMIHDFGDRAGSCAEESEVLGMAHLTSHFGTDTVVGAYVAWKESGNKPIGCSIKALAHRIVQGFKEESQAYLSLYESAPNTFTSHVGDCYDFYNAVDQYLIPLAQKAKETGGVIVARPDSGDALEQIVYVLDAAKEAGLYTTQANGLVSMTHLRVIQGDSMTFGSMQSINDDLVLLGYSPPGCLVYGIGGYLRNAIARDNFGATLKLCAVGPEKRPVMKFSHTPGKGSVPGLVKVVRELNNRNQLLPTVRSLDEPGKTEMVPWFDGIDGPGIIYQEDFLTVRKRVLKDYHQYPVPAKIYSSKIRAMKKDLHRVFVQGGKSCETPKGDMF